jgi:Na+/alanine symporter
MNDLENQLSELLKKAMDVANKTGDFVIDQAPDVLQEFYKWNIASDIMGILLFIFTCILFYVAFKKATWEYWDTSSEIISIILACLTFVTFIMACVCIYDLVFILSAPKLYLIQYFTK